MPFGTAFSSYKQPSGDAATTANITWYVDPAGSDLNDGLSALTPLATIQAALDRTPKILYHLVRIQLAAGNFAGCFIDGFFTRIARNPATDYTGLEIRGTVAAVTPATGNGTGTVTSYTAASGASEAVITDSVQALTVDDVKGKFLEILSGTGFPGTEVAPPLLPIVSNTATSFTVRGPVTAAGATYRIVDMTSVINSAVTPAVGTGSIPGATLTKCGIKVGYNSGGILGFSRFKISMSASLAGGIQGIGPSGWRAIALHVVGTGATTFFSASTTVAGTHDTGLVNVAQCSIQLASASTAFSFGNASLRQLITDSFLEGGGGASGSAFQLSNTNIRIGTTTIRGFLNGVFFSEGLCRLFITSSKMDAGAGAMNFGIVASNGGNGTPLPGGPITLLNVDISNAAIAAIQLRDSQGQLFHSSGGGSGNAIGIDLQQGAKAKVASGVTLTGTVEVSLDGTGTTLALMRLASPKVLPVVASPYGTAIFE